MTDLADTIVREVGRLLRSAKDMHAVLVARERPVLDPPAFALLGRIAERQPLRLSALASAVFLDVSTISRQVNDLEQAGWVVRKPDPHDRRASLLELTSAGQGVLKAGYEQRRLAVRSILADWTDEEQAQFAGHLAHFNESVKAFRATCQINDDQQESV